MLKLLHLPHCSAAFKILAVVKSLKIPQFDSPRTARHRAQQANEAAIHADSKGKAYKPLPKLEQPRSAGLRIGIVAAIAVAAVTVGIGIRSLRSARHSASTAPALTASATQFDDTQILFLSSQDLDLDATTRAKSALARGEVPLILRNASVDTRRQVASGERQLYSLRLMDFADEDGDAVSVAVNGISHGELVLANAGARLIIPLKPGERTSISITAVRDGTGGVTFRALSSRGEMRTRTMALGESETWTVVFQ